MLNLRALLENTRIKKVAIERLNINPDIAFSLKLGRTTTASLSVFLLVYKPTALNGFSSVDQLPVLEFDTLIGIDSFPGVAQIMPEAVDETVKFLYEHAVVLATSAVLEIEPKDPEILGYTATHVTFFMKAFGIDFEVAVPFAQLAGKITRV